MAKKSILISLERKELLRWNKNYFLSFLKETWGQNFTPVFMTYFCLKIIKLSFADHCIKQHDTMEYRGRQQL